MKTQIISTVLLLASGLQQAAATNSGDFVGASSYQCPNNPIKGSQPPHCTPNQSGGGWDFGNCPKGNFGSYDGYNFKKWTCYGGNSKRFNHLGARTSFSTTSDYIQGTMSANKDDCPSISCASGPDFSISSFDLDVDEDCDVEFEYTMPGGGKCHQSASCSSSGNTVNNDYCGGATGVTVSIPKGTKSGKPSCGIRFHHVHFDCSTTTSTSSHTTATSTSSSSSSTSSSVAAQTTSSSSSVSSSAATSATSSSISSSVYSPPTSSSSSVYSPPTSTSSSSSSSSTSSVYVYSNSTSSSSVSSVYSPPTSSSETSATTSPPSETYTTTVVVDTTVTTCPVTNTKIVGTSTSIEVTSTVSTIYLTSTSTVCPKCQHKATSTSSAAPSGPTASCPPVLPSCLNTFLPNECKDNTDVGCYCPYGNVTAEVFGCIYAYGASASEIASAIAYFQGICAPYVPTNPNLVTGAGSSNNTAPISGPVTTIVVATTITVPCTNAPGAPPTTTYSTQTISTAITVPAVVFQTAPGSSVGLIAGVAPATSAAPAAPAATQTTAATGTGAASAAQFTGAASKGGVAAGVLAAAFAFAVFAV